MGSPRLEIQHVTGYRYAGAVTASYNEVRLSPVRARRQVVLDHSVDVRPTARLARFTDYWGSVVHAFDLHRAHRELTVVATSHVETAPEVDAPPDPAPAWAELEADDVQDRWCEYVMTTDYTEPSDEIAALSARVRRAADPVAAVATTVELVRDLLTYERGTTHVGTTASEALAARTGVCQDFAHVALAVLRGAGVPARYASGYLVPRADLDVGETVEGESHAWFEAWVGDWYAVDPTNGLPVGADHVLVARGRDYGDVPPLRGLYHGGRAEALDVQVSITRRA